ncbi:DHH family phosphoesterase [Bacillus horti]|uniref:Cyclic-di-AMP phosphodiesterase n=1 Tax=Caldalkalibacillus horti TaxID=77523 RepID=A0ABT9W234_9BACI|nr:DHH family phosphoesterase [Bacillus horti]MDQ0167132.1 c-di-AMP phosphodiesterase-like protein [Bacillus horti]
MPGFLANQTRRRLFFALTLIAVLLALAVSWYVEWIIGLSAFLLLAGVVFQWLRSEKKAELALEEYIATLTYRVKKVGEDIVSDLPMGIILYDEERKLVWSNKYITELLAEEESIIGRHLVEMIPKLEAVLDQAELRGTFRFEDVTFAFIHEPEERKIHLFDQTEFQQLQVKYKQEQVVFIQVHVDNIDEVSQSLDEQRRALLLSEVTKMIDQWAKDVGIYLRRTSSDKFFGVLTEQTLKRLEEGRFDILDTVREKTSNNRVPITLSIGVGSGADDFVQNGQLAQSSLDIALGRGGDQAAVKRGTGKVTFYGGKSNAVEKRTRVRARVISHALKDLIKESDYVFVMGHKGPDMDSVGSALGVLKAVEVNEKQGFIVLDLSQPAPGITRLLEEIKQDEDIAKHFISPAKALELKTEESLLVMVDMHKPSLALESKLIDQIPRRVVIDHHRRGEEFIPDPLLVYIEPYASSTSELVTELLEYQSSRIQMHPLEATAMLAGIVVDTNHFAFRTGSRTFEAASYLRHHGADTGLIQKLLKEDKEQFVLRAKMVEDAELYRGNIAISVAEMSEKYGQVLIAQAADTLLKMNRVVASFVLSQRADGVVTISARSLGDLNVQVIMEKMGGGGHLTNAATQLEDTNVEEALEQVKSVIDEHIEGREEG